jgi:hypothetical protein
VKSQIKKQLYFSDLIIFVSFLAESRFKDGQQQGDLGLASRHLYCLQTTPREFEIRQPLRLVSGDKLIQSVSTLIRVRI